MDNDTDVEFFTRIAMFVAQIDNENDLKALFTACLYLPKDRPNKTAEEYLNAIIQVAERHDMLS